MSATSEVSPEASARLLVVAEQEFVRGSLARMAPIFSPALSFVASIAWWSPQARERWLGHVDAAIIDLDASDNGWSVRAVRELLESGIAVTALESSACVEQAALVRNAPRCTVLSKATHTPQSIVTAVAESIGVASANNCGSVALSAAQEKVMRLFASGLSHAQIAEHMGISPDTVKTHLKRIREKFRAQNVHLLSRADIYKVAGQLGLVG